MPRKNVTKIPVKETYYHVYNRGVNSAVIFIEPEDYLYFERLLARHLGVKHQDNSPGKTYISYRDKVKLNCYCLMPNHFHLLLYQHDCEGVQNLMKSVCIAYTMYLNKKYQRKGPLFESTYKSVPVVTETQLLHISRYIHLNHSEYISWPHSSYHDYITPERRSWLNTKLIKQLFKSTEEYKDFINDYDSMKKDLKTFSLDLANQY